MKVLLLTIAILSLVACGGGEDSSVQNNNQASAGSLQTEEEKIALSSLNALDVAAATFGARSSIMEAGSSSFAVNLNSPSSLSKTVNLSGIATKTVTSVAPASVAGFEQTFACHGSGFVSIIPQMANPETGFAPGDYVTSQFNNCVDSMQNSLHGEVTLIFSYIEGKIFASSTFSYTADIEFEDLQAADNNGFRVNINGDISVTQVSTEESTTIEISSSRINMGGSQNLVLETLYSTDIEYKDTSTYTSESSGKITDQNLGGEVSFITSKLFEGFLGEYPSSGEMEISGAAGSKIRVSAISAEQVNIAIDADGDGQFEDSFNHAWDSLEHAL
ncbi:hypothetical protein SAMN02745866_01157 [Alteromonadaceae bacterium Bs31]|nr:hypothetical protein SAMN02745866_01157 [Alteromonadaceae bacterium Bs31]